jgi:hypothetical protein
LYSIRSIHPQLWVLLLQAVNSFAPVKNPAQLCGSKYRCYLCAFGYQAVLKTILMHHPRHPQAVVKTSLSFKKIHCLCINCFTRAWRWPFFVPAIRLLPPLKKALLMLPVLTAA